MKAADVMVRDVITIGPDESVARATQLMTENDVSALPVVAADGRLIGIISEADLLRREEIDTTARHPRWVETMTPATALAAEFAKSHGKRVADLMSENVISVVEDTPLNEIAALLERNRIKRVPVVRDNRVVGIVSRTNLIQALASAAINTKVSSEKSRTIREELLSRLNEQPWTEFGGGNVIVKDGEVHLWGIVTSEAERKALVVLAEGVQGVTKVVDETIELVWSKPKTSDGAGQDAGTGIATATTVAVVAVGAAALEAAMLPAIALGVVAAWLPSNFPRIGRTLNPLFRSTVRNAYKATQRS